MTVDGFKTETELENERKVTIEKKEIAVKPCGERLKQIFRDAAETKSDDVQRRTDSILASQEGDAEIERYKTEVLELAKLETSIKGRSLAGERLKIYHGHETRWLILERQYADGQLTPLKK